MAENPDAQLAQSLESSDQTTEITVKQEMDASCSSGIPSEKGKGALEIVSGKDLQPDTFLNSGCPNMNVFLGGGIPEFGLTEIVGPSASGKTQLALQLALMAQLPKSLGGREAAAVYINTESVFPSNRLAELAKAFQVKYPGLPKIPMDNILVKQIRSSDALVNCVMHELRLVMLKHKIGIIILDSIAAVFRNELDDNYERSTKLKLVGKTLTMIAAENKIPLVVLNQVTASMDPANIYKFVPALGMTWGNFVTTRIQLTKREEDEQRVMDVLISPYLPVRRILFEIYPDGIACEPFSV